MKTAAVICAAGLGDALLMMIASSALKKQGYEVVVFHHQPQELTSLFPHVTFRVHPPLQELEGVLKSFDVVLVENDHSERAWHLLKMREAEHDIPIVFFLPTPCKAQREEDFLFNPQLPMATNIALACKKLLHVEEFSKDNGLEKPSKIHRAHARRIAIHPTSLDAKRNWLKKQFLSLAKKLQNKGYEIAFVMSPGERTHWLDVQDLGMALPLFPTLKDLAAYLYESGYFIGNDSGIGHLASNLHIPTLTISGNYKRVRLWRPDWSPSEIAVPPFPLPNFKGIHLRFRENFWQYFVPTCHTLKQFEKLRKKDEKSSGHIF